MSVCPMQRFSQGDLETVTKPIWNKKAGLSVSITHHSCWDGNNLITHSRYWSWVCSGLNLGRPWSRSYAQLPQSNPRDIKADSSSRGFAKDQKKQATDIRFCFALKMKWFSLFLAPSLPILLSVWCSILPSLCTVKSIVWNQLQESQIYC